MTHLKSTLFLSLFLVGCGAGDSLPLQIEKGNTALSQKDYRAATIEFKSALQRNPNSVDARLGMAKVLIHERKFNEAVIELENAMPQLDLNSAEGVDAAILLAYSYSELQLLEKLEKLNSKNPGVQYFNTIQNRAETEIKSDELLPDQTAMTQEFEKLIPLAVKLFNSPETSLIKEITDYIAVSPLDIAKSSAALLLAEAGATLNDPESMITGLTIHTEVYPSDAARQLQLVDLLVNINRNEQAKPIALKLLRQNKQHPLLNELVAAIYLSEQDYDQALSYSRIATANNPRSPRGRIVAALSEIAKGESDRAADHLSFIKDILPPQHPIRLLYVDLLLNQMKYDDALTYALESQPQSSEQVDQLARLGIQFSDRGLSDHASKILGHIRSLNAPNTMNTGMLELALNDGNGVGTLEKLRNEDPASVLLNHSVAAAYLATNNLDGALALSDEWANGTEEQKIESIMLKGVVATRKGEHNASLRYFQDVVSQKPGHVMATSGIIETLITLGETEKAKETLINSITSEQSPILMKSYAASMLQQKSSDEANRFLKEIIEPLVPAQAHEIALLIGQSQLLEKDYDSMLKTINPHQEKLKERLEFWMMKSLATQESQQFEDAAQAYLGWLEIAPSSKPALLGAVNAMEKINDISGAVDTLEKAKKFHSDHVAIDLISLQLLVRDGRWPDVKRVVSGLPAEVRANPTIIGFEGMAMAAQGDYPAAERRLSIAISSNPDPDLLRFLVTAQERNGKMDEAKKTIENYLSKKKGDSLAYVLLGNNRGMTNDWAASEAAFEKALTLGQDSPMLMNNYAYALTKNGKHNDAIIQATKALDLMPGNIQISDTLAQAHLNNGEPEKALLLMLPFHEKKAIAQDDMMMTLLDSLIQSGQVTKAKDEARKFTWKSNDNAQKYTK